MTGWLLQPMSWPHASPLKSRLSHLYSCIVYVQCLSASYLYMGESYGGM